MIFCQGLRLYDKITEMETGGWEEAKALIRKHSAATSLKADLEQNTGSSGHVVNSILGAGNKFPGQSPGPRTKHDNGQRGRNKTPQGRRDRRDSSQGRRDSSNTRLCYNCNEISNNFANNCPEPERENGLTGGRTTPYPRTIKLRATWGKESLKDTEKEKGNEAGEEKERGLEDPIQPLANFEPEPRKKERD